MKIDRSELLDCLPREWPQDLLPTIRARVHESGYKVVVLDDDPTGTQTVCGVPVLTEWSLASLEQVLREPEPLVYLLLNSRSVPLGEAQTMNRAVAANLRAASRAAKRPFVVVSRSDSTLRGHYPGEVTALIEALDEGASGPPIDGVLLIPFFFEGGRVTINDMHYVAEGEGYVPAGETEYARDAAFGYRRSNLREWVSEKTGGRIRPNEVESISIDDVRVAGPNAVTAKLERLFGGRVCIVNAASYSDLEVFVLGLVEAEARGKRFVYRSGASFVRVRAGMEPCPLLTGRELKGITRERGGLIIAGSYIQKSTLQIQAASLLPGMVSIEVEVGRLLDPAAAANEIGRVARAVEEALGAGSDVLVYTSRELVTGTDHESSLRIGQAVSNALVEIVRRVKIRPAWMIAKGGITSSDMATRALGMRRALVRGQAIPGIPIWELGAETRWPGLTYVVFPGNVGGPNAIADMVQVLRGA